MSVDTLSVEYRPPAHAAGDFGRERKARPRSRDGLAREIICIILGYLIAVLGAGGRGARFNPHAHRRRSRPRQIARPANGAAAEDDSGAEGGSVAQTQGRRSGRRSRPLLRRQSCRDLPRDKLIQAQLGRRLHACMSAVPLKILEGVTLTNSPFPDGKLFSLQPPSRGPFAPAALPLLWAV
jgi:hypothetical protein